MASASGRWLVEQLADAGVDVGQPPLQRDPPARVSITPCLEGVQTRALAADDAVAGARGAGIDAEDEHAGHILRARSDASRPRALARDRSLSTARGSATCRPSAVLAVVIRLDRFITLHRGVTQGAGALCLSGVRGYAPPARWPGPPARPARARPRSPPSTRSSTVPSADILSLSGMSVARDGTGGRGLHQERRRRARTCSCRGSPAARSGPARRSTPASPAPSSQPVIAAGQSGLLLVGLHQRRHAVRGPGGRADRSAERARRPVRRARPTRDVDLATSARRTWPSPPPAARAAATCAPPTTTRASGRWSHPAGRQPAATPRASGPGVRTWRPPVTASGSWPGARTGTSTPDACRAPRPAPSSSRPIPRRSPGGPRCRPAGRDRLRRRLVLRGGGLPGVAAPTARAPSPGC